MKPIAIVAAGLLALAGLWTFVLADDENTRIETGLGWHDSGCGTVWPDGTQESYPPEECEPVEWKTPK